jgi:hypothetical protein
LTQHERKVREVAARLIERRHMDASKFKSLMEAPTEWPGSNVKICSTMPGVYGFGEVVLTQEGDRGEVGSRVSGLRSAQLSGRDRFNEPRLIS